jgi:hypothetical protein
MSNTLTTRLRNTPESNNTSSEQRSWIWPLPRLDNLAPCILTPFTNKSSGDVEVGYRERASSSDLVPVFAARDGIITYVSAADGSPTLYLDHAGGWSTQYSELAHVLARPTDPFRKRRKERVRAGDVIGHAPRTSIRIRFSLSRLSDAGCIMVDPGEWMPTWSMLPWFELQGSHRPRRRSV